MNRKQVIETLKMENELVCFNPLTGEEIPLEYVNDLNRNCYDAHQEAIRLINNSIPIEWIEKYIEDHTQYMVTPKYEDTHFTDPPIDYYTKLWPFQVAKMLERWEKENEN